MSTTMVALNGGEDFELIFTVPLAELDTLRRIEGIHVIGHVTEPEAGNYLVTTDGAEIRLRARRALTLVFALPSRSLLPS